MEERKRVQLFRNGDYLMWEAEKISVYALFSVYFIQTREKEKGGKTRLSSGAEIQLWQVHWSLTFEKYVF